MNNVYVRVTLYVLMYAISLLPVWAMGLIELKTLADGTHDMVVHLEAAVAAGATAIAANIGIYKKWGTK